MAVISPPFVFAKKREADASRNYFILLSAVVLFERY